jgi:hypothetical protein
MTAKPWTDTSESVRRCIGERRGDRVGDNGGIDARSCAEGEFGRGSPYGGAVRSGLIAKGFHGGDMPSLEGDGGSMWTACSLRRASLAVLLSMCVRYDLG